MNILCDGYQVAEVVDEGNIVGVTTVGKTEEKLMAVEGLEVLSEWRSWTRQLVESVSSSVLL